MLVRQIAMPLSPYTALYDIVVSENHLLRKMLELVDFSFIYDELKNKYCHDNGRNAEDPIRLFKYILLKVIYQLSDVDVVERSRTDLAFKFFLGMAPEEDVIHPSLLAKFRKLRLKAKDLLDLLIKQSVQIAIESGVIKSNAIIVDSTHSGSRYNKKSPQEYGHTPSLATPPLSESNPRTQFLKFEMSKVRYCLVTFIFLCPKTCAIEVTGTSEFIICVAIIRLIP